MDLRELIERQAQADREALEEARESELEASAKAVRLAMEKYRWWSLENLRSTFRMAITAFRIRFLGYKPWNY